MNIQLGREGIQELFKQYATPALVSEMRNVVREELKDKATEEIERKLSSYYFTKDRFEREWKELLHEKFNRWYLKTYKSLNDEMKDTLVNEFKAKTKNVNWDKVEAMIFKVAKFMIESKMNNYAKILKRLDAADNKMIGVKQEGLGALFE